MLTSSERQNASQTSFRHKVAQGIRNSKVKIQPFVIGADLSQPQSQHAVRLRNCYVGQWEITNRPALMRILFLHQNFPGQFVHLTSALRARGADMHAVTDIANTRPSSVATLRYMFDSARFELQPSSHFAQRMARGEKVGDVMLSLKRDGFVPDLVIGHFGWGETLFVKDVFPQTKLIVYAEYYYQQKGADIGFGAEPSQFDIISPSTKAKNAAILSALVDADYGVAPTHWQGSRFPHEFKSKIAVIHEGIKTDVAKPKPNAFFRHADQSLELSRADEVITFVNRNLEPYRGYHIFMRALPNIMKARPNARVVIVGGDEVSYGPAPSGGRSWKDVFLDEVREDLPMHRVHFVGKIPYADFIALMQVSLVHVYLTYPFVLSWSLLEAMSAGALVVGSRTAPVEEVIEDGVNGLLVDFFDKQGLADKVIEVLEAPARFAHLRRAARQTVLERYDLKKCLAQWLGFLDVVMRDGQPARLVNPRQ